jgi:hypothetical protein
MTASDPHGRRGEPPAGGGESEPVPLGQRLLDRPFLLLAACLVVMFALYTGWGVLEILWLEPAPLP